jgi:hypothetical protein
MYQWYHQGFEGLNTEKDIPKTWQQIMRQFEATGKRLLIQYRTDESIPRYNEAARMYCQEKVTLLD